MEVKNVNVFSFTWCMYSLMTEKNISFFTLPFVKNVVYLLRNPKKKAFLGCFWLKNTYL